MELIEGLLRQMLERDGSDLHLVAGDPPRIRIFGDLITLDHPVLDNEALRVALDGILPRAQAEMFKRHDQVDFAHSVDGLARFRVNVFRHLGGVGAIMRAIPSTALTLEELRMPDSVRNLCNHAGSHARQHQPAP